MLLKDQFRSIARKRGKGVIGLWYWGVNCISPRLHRDSVCPVDWETSVIIISRRRRQKRVLSCFSLVRDENEGKETWTKRNLFAWANARLWCYISISKVFNSHQSMVLVQKGIGRWRRMRERERESNRRKRVAAGWTIPVFLLTATTERNSCQSTPSLWLSLCTSYDPTGSYARACLHV